MSERFAVVGAGPAGLSAAWELARGGAAVTLYDARDRPGGRMRSDMLGGAVVDVAVQLYASTFRSLFRLAHEVGADKLLARTSGRDALWRNGRAHPLTYGSVTSMVTSTALPAGLKLRLATRYLPFLASATRRVDPNDPARSGAAELDAASVAEWGRAALGEEFVELLAYPLLGAYYGGAPEDISAALYHALAKVGTDVRVYAVRGGVGSLAERILDALRSRGAAWRRGEKVERLDADGGGVEVTSADGAERFDGVVIATPPGPARELIGARPEAGAWLGGVRSAPTVTVALLLDRIPAGDWFGLSFPRRTGVGDVVVASCAQHRKLRGLVPDGEALLLVFPAPAVATELSLSSAETVVTRVLSALEEPYPNISGSVRHARVYPLAEGYTLFHTGYFRHILRYDEKWLPARVALAGDYLVHPTVEGAVASGVRAARRLTARAAR